MILFSSSLGGSPKSDASARLKLEGDTLTASFFVSAPAWFNAEYEANTFVEGLWHFDCAELFVGSSSSGRYFEINLAPNGAWWTCLFEGVRKRDLHTRRPRVHVEAALHETSWQASVSVSVSDLMTALESEHEDDLIGNCTLVLGGCPDLDVPLENLHSLVELGAVDFHRPQDWVPLDELLKRS
jgi:hypothetical protein